jgi:hypothetical protein
MRRAKRIGRVNAVVDVAEHSTYGLIRASRARHTHDAPIIGREQDPFNTNTTRLLQASRQLLAFFVPRR